MGKHKVIRGLPRHLAAASKIVAHDLDSDAETSKIRIRMLRDIMTTHVLEKAARGVGPRLMQAREILSVLEEAGKHNARVMCR